MQTAPHRHMEAPPPVPPKDTPKTDRMEVDSRPASAKRKRDEQDDTVYDLINGRLEPVDLDAHTPKKSRQSDTEPSETTPVGNRGLRRKKKVNNLSNLNLRHAAEKQQAAQLQARESKFQEGSLTDKPSAKPPSAFTRMIRTDSGNIKQVDELMEGYDNEATQTSVVPAEPSPLMSEPASEIAPAAGSGGFFRFGRSFASSFHPIALWNKMWNETREELIRKNLEEAERKQRQKEEAEARYAQMKAAGQLGLQPVSNAQANNRSSGDVSMRDSAIVMDSARTSQEHKRTISDGSSLLPPPRDDTSGYSGSEVPDTAAKSKGTFRSRFAFRKPSVSNLKEGLKRVKSDFNLAAAAATARESSSSVSPVKADFDQSTLKRSTSKFDLRKQQKLSKRVSDLEAKLSVARRELDSALIEASPAPKLNNKYERFTPQSTLKRPRFVPGQLPSLPSERILMAEQLGFGDDEASPEKGPARQVNGGSGDSESMVIDGEDTIKASRARPYPTRASSLFKLDDDAIGTPPLIENKPTLDQDNNQTSELTQISGDSADMDPNSINDHTNNGAAEPVKTGDYASLDAKLKALDKNVKIAKKPAGKSRKRKSGGDGDKLFRPTTTTDDDDDWVGKNETPKKKRKSGGASGSPPAKRGRPAKAKQGSPQGKKVVNGAAKGTRAVAKALSPAQPIEDEEQYSEAEPDDAQPGADADEAPTRTSLDSQGVPLEPVYEEEEETSTIALNDEPSKPTATATPARLGLRSRSNSPHKRNGSVQPAAEETIITRAAEAAKGARSVLEGGEMAGAVSATYEKSQQMQQTSLVGGEEVTTKKVVKMRVSNGGDGEFEWPEDVF